MGRPTFVRAELQLRLVLSGAAPLPVRAGLHYSVEDPYAVRVSFHTGPGQAGDVVQWTFARCLLGDGVAGPAGDGDVQVWPSGSTDSAVVCLSLSSPSGNALFEVPAPELVRFLDQTYASCPPGHEGDHVDVEAELAHLLEAEPGA